jgi:hypothetical protein
MIQGSKAVVAAGMPLLEVERSSDSPILRSGSEEQSLTATAGFFYALPAPFPPLDLPPLLIR